MRMLFIQPRGTIPSPSLESFLVGVFFGLLTIFRSRIQAIACTLVMTLNLLKQLDQFTCSRPKPL